LRLSSIDRLRCVPCLRLGVESPYELDATRVGGGEDGGAAGDLLEGFLVCRRCRDARPVVGGIAIAVVDLDAHLIAHGNVYRPPPIAAPGVPGSVRGGAGTGGDGAPFEGALRRSRDLPPELPEPPEDDKPAASPAEVASAAPAGESGASPYDAALRLSVVDA